MLMHWCVMRTDIDDVYLYLLMYRNACSYVLICKHAIVYKMNVCCVHVYYMMRTDVCWFVLIWMTLITCIDVYWYALGWLMCFVFLMCIKLCRWADVCECALILIMWTTVCYGVLMCAHVHSCVKCTDVN